MPTIEVDLILVALIAAFLFGAGYETEKWHVGSQHAAELQAQITATNLAEQKVNIIASQFESSSQQSKESQAQLLEKWRISDEKAHTVCMLTADDLSLLATATSENVTSR